MLKSRLFWKLFLAFAGLNLLAAIVFGIVISGWQEGQIIEQVDRRLQDSATMLRDQVADMLSGSPTQQLQNVVRRLGQQTDTRFTVVALDGTVLADSEKANLELVSKMESHRYRPEIVAAASLQRGTAERFSATLQEPYRYLALRVDVEGQPAGIVRSALTVASIQKQAAATQRLILGLAVLISFGILLLSYWLVGHFIRPVVTLTDAAEAMTAGDYQQRVYIRRRDELGLLAQSFNRMCQELNSRMAQLMQSGQRQATVLGGMTEGVIAVDDRERVVFANAAAGQLFDFVPPNVEGRPLLEVVRHHALHEAVAAALSQRRPQRLETEWEADEVLSIDIQAAPMPGEPCPGAVLVLHDVTELRRLETLRQEFIANVSHELKTPLSSIKAYAETLQNGALNDTDHCRKFVRRIEEQADRLNHLILDMLSLARIESDSQALEIVPVDIAEVVNESLDDHRATADAKQINLAAKTNESALRVLADREGLREILDNLIDNALKNTPSGGEIAVSWRTVEGHMAEIAVHDTGIGIAEADLPRVFERFYRADKARSREQGGTGLGLAIVKHLVQAFDGTVGVQNNSGQGCTFTVQLPPG